MRGTRYWIGLLLVAGISAPAVAQDITSNLSGQWKLIETSGTTAVDSSSTANNGTYTNGLILANSTPVPVSSAVAARFDGTDDFVAIPNEALYDAVGVTTVACWIKVNAWTVADQAIIAKGDTASARLTRDGINNGVAFVCRGLTIIRVASTTTVNDGKWHHVAGIYTGSQLRIYIDGILNNSVGSLGFISTNNFPVQIGGNAEVAGKNFNGWIYDVRFYARALSPVDVSYLYLQGGPVGQWKLAETSGTTAADSSLYGATGAVTGTTHWSTDCGGMAIFDFDGSTNYISIPSATQLQPTSAMTIAAWIKGNSWGVADVVNAILRKGEANPSNYQLDISDGRVELLLDGNDAAGFRGNTVLKTGQWYHVAATWDGSVVTIYVNGVLDNTPVSRTGTIGTDARALYIGGRPGTDLFNGSLRDVRLYNRALSGPEIQKLAGLLGYWKFSEGAGTSAADTSGQGNNATLSGGATWTSDCAGNNNALLTNGTGGIAQTTAPFNPPDVGTVAFWLRSTGAPAGVARIIGLGGDWEIRQQVDGTVVTDLCGDGATTICTVTPLTEVGRWYHLAFTFDSSNNTYAIYVDGQLERSGTNPVDMVQQPAALLSFGTRTGAAEYWSGALRDVRVYNRKLCPSEIQSLYGLLLYLKLDETSGTTAADSSGLANNGTYTGGPTLGVSAPANFGAYFPSDNKYVIAPASGTLNTLGVNNANFSVAFWVKPATAPGGWRPLLHKGGADYDRGPGIWLNAGNNRVHFRNSTTANNNEGTDSVAALPTNGWSHVACVKAGNKWRCYINAILDTEYTLSGNTTGNNGPLYLGDSPWYPGSNVYMDDVRIYNRALCPTEIQQIKDLGSAFGGVKITKWIEVQ